MPEPLMTMKFKKDGTVEISDEPGENAEKRLKQLGINLGDIEFRGHKHAHTREEGVKITQGGSG